MLLHLVGVLSSRFAHDARSQEHKASNDNLISDEKITFFFTSFHLMSILQEIIKIVNRGIILCNKFPAPLPLRWFAYPDNGEKSSGSKKSLGPL